MCVRYREMDSFPEAERWPRVCPSIRLPNLKLPYILDTDASAMEVGAVLSQVQEGVERVIAYYSKTLVPPER